MDPTLGPRLPGEGVKLLQVRAAASWERLITSRTTARLEPRLGGPCGGGEWGRQLGDGTLWKGQGDWLPPRSWEMGRNGGAGVLNATGRGGLRAGGGALCGGPGLKSRRERAEEETQPLTLEEWGKGVQQAPSRSMAPSASCYG